MKVRGHDSLPPPCILSRLRAGPSHRPVLYCFNTCVSLETAYSSSRSCPYTSKWQAKSHSPLQLESGLALIPSSCCLAQQCWRLQPGSGSCHILCSAYYQSLAVGLSCRSLGGTVASALSASRYQSRRSVDSWPETLRTVTLNAPRG